MKAVAENACVQAESGQKQIKDVICGEKIWTISENGLLQLSQIHSIEFWEGDIEEGFIELCISLPKKVVLTMDQEVITWHGPVAARDLTHNSLIRTFRDRVGGDWTAPKAINHFWRKRKWVRLNTSRGHFLANGIQLRSYED